MLFSSGLVRRAFLRNLTAGAVSSYLPLLAECQQDSGGEVADPQLDRFVNDYIATMNAPGLTLALANKTGVVRTAGFGYSDLETKSPVTPDMPFEIGSITKSSLGLRFCR